MSIQTVDCNNNRLLTFSFVGMLILTCLFCYLCNLYIFVTVGYSYSILYAD